VPEGGPPTLAPGGPVAAIRIEGLARAAERVAVPALAVAAVLGAVKLAIEANAGRFGFDFRGTIWQAARDVLHGRNPYPAPDAHQLLLAGHPAVYPPDIFLVAAPLGWLPFAAAVAVWDVAMAACLVAALRVVGVRDRRVYAAVLVSYPLIASLALGQIDGLLALGCALAWRYRNRPAGAAAAVAGVIATKLFLWPLAFWLLVTGRVRAGLGAVAGAAVLMAVAWGVIGFDGFREYPRLLRALADAFQGRGYSPVATALRAGVPVGEARLLAPLVLVLLLAATARLARSDDRSFAAAVAAGVFGVPIVWMHSVAILLVAVAVVRRTFGAIWLLPLAFWVSQNEPPRWPLLLVAQLLMVALLAVTLRTQPD
jgi:hypothetical protein